MDNNQQNNSLYVNYAIILSQPCFIDCFHFVWNKVQVSVEWEQLQQGYHADKTQKDQKHYISEWGKSYSVESH